MTYESLKSLINVCFKDLQSHLFLHFQVSKDIKTMIDVKEERHRGVVDPRDARKGGSKFYKYIGSLTVPPCTEGVTWIIHKKVLCTSSIPTIDLLELPEG